MARHKVEITGVNTANIVVLSNEEMTKLFLRMKEGDLVAREELVNGNLKLVLSILKKYIDKSDNLDDLFQVGCIGLLKAIDNFDLSYQVKFSTYAVPMILGEVKRHIRDDNAVRISRSIKDTAYRALTAKEEIFNKTNQEPSTKDIADALNISEYEVIQALECLRDPISMFEAIYNDGGDTIYLCDQLEDKKEHRDLDMKVAIDRAMKKLNDRERKILNDRFLIGKTQMEIAEEIGISQAQISRLEKGALESIKKMIK